tara:strand:+ start:510 stop:683 length:174 start_codon:yes stop_codon:yes gene_type:complete
VIEMTTFDEFVNVVPFVLTEAMFPPEVEKLEVASGTEDASDILSEKFEGEVSSRKRP